MTETIQGVRPLNARVLMVTTYDDVPYAAQNSVWTYLKVKLNNSSTPDGAKTKNVFDKIPKDLIKVSGFPIVEVPLPVISEEFITFTKKKMLIEFDINIYSDQSSNIRRASAYIRQILQDNESAFRDLKLYQYLNTNTTPTRETILAGKDVYVYTMTIQFVWTGVP